MATAEQGDDRQSEIARRVWGRISERLAEKDMPISRLAETIGYDRTMLYRWRRGETPMNADVLAALEQALQLPYGELHRLAGKPAPALPGYVGPVSVAIISADELDQHAKEALLRTLETERGRMALEARVRDLERQDGRRTE